jgi:ribokinase
MPSLRASYLRLIQELGGLGYQVALDTNWPPQGWDDALRAEVGSWIANCQHVLLNELEITSLADTPDLEVAAQRVASQLKPDATLVVKTGARGALGIQNGRRFDASALPAAIFDTIGAGDSFNAGYLLACLNGAGLAEALTAGCHAATAIISRFPRRPILPGELARALAPLRAAIGVGA